MEKVETYQQQPPLPLQQQQPPPPPQQQQQLTMPPLVENCVTTSDKLIKHVGYKSINKKTGLKWPLKGHLLYKLHRLERRKQMNNLIPRSACPKSPLMIFLELFNHKSISLQKYRSDNVIRYVATVCIDGQEFYGNNISPIQAQEEACEKFLRIMLAKQLSEQSENKEESPMNVEMEVEENGSVLKPKGPPQEDFPCSHLVSLAMYNLINQWNIQLNGSTVIEPQPKTVSKRKFPENPKIYNPISLLYLMKPNLKYIETVIVKFPPLFQVNCTIDGILFTGKGPKKKLAKKECCTAAIKYFWQFDFHAIENN
ncbi:hypothetical protein AGLY_012475 [Aphis glycines]|uniref:DRBM domain-containing protein n=1 Tax=Aphis glycines TaxID=307491 RepID=A0A6G0TA67_APHGL|nr:hypothetical protein AGLY_012475 [Aphis glycines]